MCLYLVLCFIYVCDIICARSVIDTSDTGKGDRMKRYDYRTCPYCGANLDPGETCDCRRERHADNEESNYTRFDYGAFTVPCRMQQAAGTRHDL